MKRTWFLVLLIVVCLPCSGYASPLYSLTNLGTVASGGMSVANAISPGGIIVGYAKSANNQNHAFVYSNGVFTDLGTGGGTGATAYGVNDAGTVVGSYLPIGANGDHAFIYSNGSFQDLNPTLGSPMASGLDGDQC